MEINDGRAEITVKDSDIKRQLDSIRDALQTIGDPFESYKYSKSIITKYTSGPHRLIKLMSYPLLRSINTLEWSNIEGQIQSDISTIDKEIQLNAYKLLYYLPLKYALETLRVCEKDFIKHLEDAEYRYERTIILAEFLLKTYISSLVEEIQEDRNDNIIDYFLLISKNLLNTNDKDQFKLYTEILISLYNEYEQGDLTLNIIDNSFRGAGTSQLLLKGLITPITRYLFENIQKLYLKIMENEPRQSSRFQLLYSYVLEVAIEINFQQKGIKSLENKKLRVNNQIIPSFQQYVSTYLEKTILNDTLIGFEELDVFQNLGYSIFKLVSIPSYSNSIIPQQIRDNVVWSFFNHFLTYLEKNSYKREINYLSLNFILCSVTCSDNIRFSISMKILEFSCNNINNFLNRYILFFCCFYNIIEISMRFIENQKISGIYALFNQDWFVDKINNKDDISSRVKEELLICLIGVCLYLKRKYEKHYLLPQFQQIIMEVFDVTSRLLDWKLKQIEISPYLQEISYFSIDLFLLLLQEAFHLVPYSSLKPHITDLVQRINQNEICFEAKLKVLMVLFRVFDPNKMKFQFDLTTIIQEFYKFIFQKFEKSFYSEDFLYSISANERNILRFIADLENILKLLYYISIKMKIQYTDAKEQLVKFMKDYIQFLQNCLKQQGAFISLINSTIIFAENIQFYMEKEDKINMDILHISTQFLDNLEINYDETSSNNCHTLPQQYQSCAFNMFKNLLDKGKPLLSDTVENDNPIDNLRIIYKSSIEDKFLNFRSQEPQLINGIGDIIQIYASHAIKLSRQLVNINLKVYNLNKFTVENVQIKLHYKQTAYICINETNQRVVNIEEISAETSQIINFTLLVEETQSLTIYVEVKIESISSDNIYIIRSLPYKISLINFLIPDDFPGLSRDISQYYWNYLPFRLTVKVHTIPTKKQKFALNQLLHRFSISAKTIKVHQYEDIIDSETIPNFINRLISKENTKITLRLSTLTWEGQFLAISMNGIDFTSNDVQEIYIEIKTSKYKLINIIKDDINEFIQEFSGGFLEF